MLGEPIFKSRYLCKNTWLINGNGSNSYLLVGENRGIVIDTGNATENIREFAQTLTNKPVNIAANTHGHFDHTGGNGYFEQVHMSAKALEIATKPELGVIISKYLLDYTAVIVCEGDTIDLGDRKIKVIEIPAHEPGSVAFLDQKEKILFTGDEVDDKVVLVWTRDEPQPTIKQHAANMEKLLTYQNQFSYICAGHGQVMGQASLVKEHLENAQKILSGCMGDAHKQPVGSSKKFHIPQIEFKRESTHKRTTIIYDMRYVYS